MARNFSAQTNIPSLMKCVSLFFDKSTSIYRRREKKRDHDSLLFMVPLYDGTKNGTMTSKTSTDSVRPPVGLGTRSSLGAAHTGISTTRQASRNFSSCDVLQNKQSECATSACATIACGTLNQLGLCSPSPILCCHNTMEARATQWRYPPTQSCLLNRV